MASKIYLSIDELARCRDTYDTHIDDYVATVFQLRTICSDVGQYPPDEELVTCLRLCGGRLNFNMFCRYALYLKYIFNQQVQAVEEYEDTRRAFAALGGSEEGTINGSLLLETCQRFALKTDDLAVLVAELDADNSGTISFDEFRDLWRSMTTEKRIGLVEATSTIAPNFNSMTAIEKGLQGFLLPATVDEETIEQQEKKASLLPSITRKKTIMMLYKARASLSPAKATNVPRQEPQTARKPASPKAVLATLTPRPPSTRPQRDDASYLQSTYEPINLPPIKPTRPKKNTMVQARERKLEVMRSSQQRYKKHLQRNIKGFVVHDEDQRHRERISIY